MSPRKNPLESSRRALVCLALAALVAICASPAQAQSQPASKIELGHPGGRLTVALRSEPKTLNPILALDTTSREVIGTMEADLVHINRETQRIEPALATSWKVSPDGHKYTLHLRRDVKFSDGAPFTADDVVFSFQLYLDEALNSPQRDLLIIDGKPIVVRKLDTYTVEFDLTKPYGPGERIFDGLAILPKHLLEKTYRDKKLGEIWGVNAKPEELAGLGPFRLKDYVPGSDCCSNAIRTTGKKTPLEQPCPTSTSCCLRLSRTKTAR